MSEKPRKLECEEAIRMVLEYLDNELMEGDHDAMQHHLQTCRSCYTRMEFEKRLKGEVSSLSEAKAPDRLRLKIKKISSLF